MEPRKDPRCRCLHIGGGKGKKLFREGKEGTIKRKGGAVHLWLNSSGGERKKRNAKSNFGDRWGRKGEWQGGGGAVLGSKSRAKGGKKGEVDRSNDEIGKKGGTGP